MVFCVAPGNASGTSQAVIGSIIIARLERRLMAESRYLRQPTACSDGRQG